MSDDGKGHIAVDVEEYARPEVDRPDEHHQLQVVKSLQEKRLVRKLDMRVMSMLCLLYLFAYLDRVNLGNARLQGLPEDVLHGDPTGVLFDWVTSAFYFSYIICPIPATLLAKLCPLRVWFACAAIGWGVCSLLMATAFNFPGLMVARFGLGVFEAGFSPGTPVYLSLFYTKEEIGLRLAAYNGFAAFAGAFGGLIAFAIQNARTSIASWKLLFIVEGAPSVVMGILCFFVLPNRPEETSVFNEEERKLALERVNRESRADVGRMLQKKHIVAAFTDWRVYVGGIIYFAANCAFASISAFLPTIITTFGFTNALAQVLTIPPYAISTIVMCGSCYASDKLHTRGVFVVGTSALAALGYILLLTVSDNHVRYFATFCITSGTYGMICTSLAWFAHNLGSETKRATAIPLFQAVGQFGSILGAHIYPLTEGPRYLKGFSVNLALDCLAVLVAIVLTISYRTENARRDRVYGKRTGNASVDTSELADMATVFNFPGLLVARMALGVLETALSPCVPFYMSLFYTRQEIGIRLATYTGFAAVAGAFGGLLAFGVQNANASIANWKLLFIIGGIPSILIGLVTITVLPDRPEEAAMFTNKERGLAIERVNRGTKADVGRVIQPKHIAAAFRDWRVYAAGVMYFASNSNAIAQLLTIPPYAVAAVVLCVCSYAADRLQSRGVFVMAGSMLAGIGYILLLAVPADIHVRYFATFLVTSGTYTMNGGIIAWFAHNLGSETKKATGTPLYMAIGQCGAVLGSHLYPLTESPRYVKGFSVNCALNVLAAVVAIVLTVSYRRDNRHRDLKYGEVNPDAEVDTTELADKAPNFRYTP
ncbi:major facilitator superfamily domain-containing protein [Earliella scabrosa]|nr:major facilitator superfamily domain-containing protein [Earliella scabrosa]